MTDQPVVDALALDPAAFALVTIDLQRDFLSESPYGVPGTTEVLPHVLTVVDAFRACVEFGSCRRLQAAEPDDRAA